MRKLTAEDTEEQEKRERLTIGIDGYGTTFSKKPIVGDEKRERGIQAGWRYLAMFSQIGFSIALPIVLGALIGRMADTEWRSEPKGTLTGIGIGFVISIISFIRTVQSVLREKEL